MNRRWLIAGAGAVLLVVLLATLREPLPDPSRGPGAETTAPITNRAAAPVISPHRFSAGAPEGALRRPGKPVHAAQSAGECPDCKPGSVSFAPPVAPDRVVGGPPSPTDTSQANRDHSLNARLARHLSQTQAAQPSPEQARARAAQEKNLTLRGAAIERSGAPVGRPTRP